MRTTLTLDDDVYAELVKLQLRSKLKLKDAVNQALREGLRQLESGKHPSPESFEVRTFNPGRCLVGDLVSVSEALRLGDRESYK